MATDNARPDPPILTPITVEELRRRNQAVIALLDSWEAEGDEEEQRETLRAIWPAISR